MDPWDLYNARTSLRGKTKREASTRRSAFYLDRKLRNSLSYKSVTIDDTTRNVAIVATDNLDEKMIYSMPGEDIDHGALVYWMSNYWLVVEKDYDTELYARAKLKQCNYLLKWIDSTGTIRQAWCIVEDGTKSKWFGMLETTCKNDTLNCWNTLRDKITTA